jgi:cell division protein FtsB
MATTRTNGRHAPSHQAPKVTYRILHDVLALVESLSQRRKAIGAGALHSVAQTTRDYAASMTDLPNLRAQATAASEGMDNLANYALHTNVETMIVDTAAFARKHPVIAVGAAVAAGLAATLLMRSPAPVPPAASKATRKTVKARRKSTPAVKARKIGRVNASPRHA